jgi:hypothetical protein
VVHNTIALTADVFAAFVTAACPLPPHALARHDESRRARFDLRATEKSAGCDDQDQQREYGEQINLTRIVPVMIVVTDFPAH